MSVVIHHNPDCGTSRNVLAIVEAAGYAPVVISYAASTGPVVSPDLRWAVAVAAAAVDGVRPPGRPLSAPVAA